MREKKFVVLNHGGASLDAKISRFPKNKSGVRGAVVTFAINSFWKKKFAAVKFVRKDPLCACANI